MSYQKDKIKIPNKVVSYCCLNLFQNCFKTKENWKNLTLYVVLLLTMFMNLLFY